MKMRSTQHGVAKRTNEAANPTKSAPYNPTSLSSFSAEAPSGSLELLHLLANYDSGITREPLGRLYV